MSTFHFLSHTIFVILLLSTCLFSILETGNATSETTTTPCLTEDDVNGESCKYDDLSILALEAICERLGLDVQEHMFPYMFDDDEVEASASSSEDLKEEEKVLRTKDDYVAAAIQCLTIEDEMERMLAEDPEALEELERQLMVEDPSMLAEVVADVLAQSPELLQELEEELRNEDPILFQEIVEELGEGQTLADRPDILAEIVAIMLEEDPELLDKLDEELDALLAAEPQEIDPAQSEL